MFSESVRQRVPERMHVGSVAHSFIDVRQGYGEVLIMLARDGVNGFVQQRMQHALSNANRSLP